MYRSYTKCTFISKDYAIFNCIIINPRQDAPMNVVHKCNVIVNNKLEINVDSILERVGSYEDAFPISEELQKKCIERAKWIFGLDSKDDSKTNSTEDSNNSDGGAAFIA